MVSFGFYERREIKGLSKNLVMMGSLSVSSCFGFSSCLQRNIPSNQNECSSSRITDSHHLGSVQGKVWKVKEYFPAFCVLQNCKDFAGKKLFTFNILKFYHKVRILSKNFVKQAYTRK